MASAAEQLASNVSLSQFAKATDLKKRLWFTLGALIIFRLLSHVPLPGLDPRALATLFETTKGGVLDFFNAFSGGSLTRMSLIALGVMPYITASIVVQLAASLYAPWAALKKEGETGRKKIQEWTRYATVPLAMIQGAFWLSYMHHPGTGSTLVQPAFQNTTMFWVVGMAALYGIYTMVKMFSNKA